MEDNVEKCPPGPALSTESTQQLCYKTIYQPSTTEAVQVNWILRLPEAVNTMYWRIVYAVLALYKPTVGCQ